MNPKLQITASISKERNDVMFSYSSKKFSSEKKFASCLFVCWWPHSFVGPWPVWQQMHTPFCPWLRPFSMVQFPNIYHMVHHLFLDLSLSFCRFGLFLFTNNLSSSSMFSTFFLSLIIDEYLFSIGCFSFCFYHRTGWLCDGWGDFVDNQELSNPSKFHTWKKTPKYDFRRNWSLFLQPFEVHRLLS